MRGSVAFCRDPYFQITILTFIPSWIGSIMDLPYVFKSDCSQSEMDLNPGMNLEAFIQANSGKLFEFLQQMMTAK